MKNYIKPGDNMVVAAPYAVTAGAGLLIGILFGVAFAAAAKDADVTIATTGIYELKTKAADEATVGAAAYWDNTNKEVTTTATSNTKIGVFVAAKAAAATVAQVRLNGSF